MAIRVGEARIASYNEAISAFKHQLSLPQNEASEVRTIVGSTPLAMTMEDIKGQAPWASNINSEWTKRSEVVQNYQNVLDKIKNKTELDENDIKSIAEYRKRYPGKELPDTLVNAIEQHLYEKILAEVLGDDGVKYNTMSLYDAIKAISDNDWFKRGAQILGLTPKNLTKAFLQSDGVIELLGSVDKGTKGRKFVSGVMSAMARYESLGNKGGTLKKIFDGISDIASPVETIVKTGLEGARDAGMVKFGKYIKGGEEATGLLGKGLKYFPKVAKVMGKVGTVTTFADLGITAISSGVDEYSKTKDIGKAAGKAALSAIASVGPLEGATIGAAIGGIPGAAVGVFVGGVIQGIKAWKPQFFDDPVKGTKEMIDDIGNGIKGTVKNISNGIGGIGTALGFG